MYERTSSDEDNLTDSMRMYQRGVEGGKPEIAGVCIIDRTDRPRRVGLSISNEFSDHKMEKKNYFYLAPSKLRPYATEPELVIGAALDDVEGVVSILRDGAMVWSTQIKTGEANIPHSLKNLEHHHFKYPALRQAGEVHAHFFGANAFSFGAVISIAYEGFGWPLHNSLHIDRTPDQLVEVTPL